MVTNCTVFFACSAPCLLQINFIFAKISYGVSVCGRQTHAGTCLWGHMLLSVSIILSGNIVYGGVLFLGCIGTWQAI